jgi:hypothetical protein
MKNLQFLFSCSVLLILMIILSSCTTSVAGKDEHGFSPHLTVDLQVPANIELQQKIPLILKVIKSGEPFEDAEQAIFAIWQEDHKDQAVTIPASESSPGLYEAEHIFSAEGIYILQSRVASSNLEVMPAKRIAIGPEAIEKLALLEQHQEGESAAPAVVDVHHNH